LLFCHFDRYRLKFSCCGCAAYDASADADSAYGFRLIPHAYLTKLDSCLEHRSKVFDKIPEIDSGVRDKIKKNFVAVKGILYVDQLHLQAMLFDLFAADSECVFLFYCIFVMKPNVFFRRNANHVFKRLERVSVLYLPDGRHRLSKFKPSCRFNNHLHARLDGESVGIKIIHFPCIFKTYSYYFNHDE